MFSGSFLGAYCHQSGLWGGQTYGASARAFSPAAWRVAPALTQPLRAETIAGGPAQIPRPGLGHRKEAFSGKGKRLPDHSLGFERPKLV